MTVEGRGAGRRKKMKGIDPERRRVILAGLAGLAAVLLSWVPFTGGRKTRSVRRGPRRAMFFERIDDD